MSVDSVFGLPAFREGVRQVSTAVGKTDCWTYATSTDDGRTIDKSHSAHKLLSYKANDWQTSFMWKQTLVANAMWDGNGYSVIVRGSEFEPAQLVNVDSRDVYQFWIHDGFKILETMYSVTSNGKEYIVPAADMIHIRNLGIHAGQEGLGIIDICNMVLGKAIAQHKMASRVFRNGVHSTLYIEIPGWMTDEQYEELRRNLDKRKGADNAGTIFPVMGGAKLGSLPSSAEQMQLVESIQASLNDIALIVGVPVSMLGGATASVYGSVQQDALSYLQNTLDAWMTNIETELTAKLVNPDTHFVEFDRTSMFANNPDFRLTIINEWKQGAITWKEMRSRLNESTSEPEPTPVAAVVPQLPTTEPVQRSEPSSEILPSIDAGTLVLKHEDSKANQLLTATCERLQRRIAKAIEGGNLDLAIHEDVIRESLPGFDVEELITELNNLQRELKAVLPEQRQGVIDRWNMKPVYKQL